MLQFAKLFDMLIIKWDSIKKGLSTYILNLLEYSMTMWFGSIFSHELNVKVKLSFFGLMFISWQFWLHSKNQGTVVHFWITKFHFWFWTLWSWSLNISWVSINGVRAYLTCWNIENPFIFLNFQSKHSNFKFWLHINTQ